MENNVREPRVMPDDVSRFLADLVALECWYAASGGAVGSYFNLAFGDKIRRKQPIPNDAHPEKYRLFAGEAAVYVWCPWRLETLDAPWVGADDPEDQTNSALENLVSRKIETVDVSGPGDLTIRFSGGVRLTAFACRFGKAGGPNWRFAKKGVAMKVEGHGDIVLTSTSYPD